MHIILQVISSPRLCPAHQRPEPRHVGADTARREWGSGAAVPTPLAPRVHVYGVWTAWRMWITGREELDVFKQRRLALTGKK